MPATAIDEHIFEHPTHTGRIRPDHRRCPCGQASTEPLNVFEDTRAGPINIGAVLKDDINVRVAEHGLRPHSLHLGCGQQGRNNGIRDLIFNDIWRSSRPRGVNYDLHIGDVR